MTDAHANALDEIKRLKEAIWKAKEAIEYNDVDGAHSILKEALED